jgi:hypothetical protein
MAVAQSRMVLLALLPVWALACGGRAGDADRVSGSDGVSGSASEPEVLAELDGASYRLREGSGYVWWLRDGWLERVAKAGGAVEVISRASVYAVADDQLYLSESSGVITTYSLRGEPLATLRRTAMSSRRAAPQCIVPMVAVSSAASI